MCTWFLCPPLRMRNVCRSPGESNWACFQEFLSELRISALPALGEKTQPHFHWRQSAHSIPKHASEPSEIHLHRFSHLCCGSFLNNGADLSKAFYQGKNWFVRVVSGCWCLQQIRALALSCCAAARCQCTLILRGKEKRLSLSVPLDPSFTSAHFHHPIISRIQREIFAQIIQRRKSWSKFVKYFLILVGKALQKSWCTTQMDFRVVLSKLTWLLIFFPVLISVFIAHIHQAVFRKSDVITFIIVRCDIFLVLHFIILCRQ